uniref:tRNA (guanine(46)-N(7))-methyltransferase n=1 Tax=Calcidiscus leptoporus TaxID=127549 RepID=A0A7S0JKM2_9EUKA|mmetsp:Transcript_9282/g.21569  ORF Transcript_9282/g.21569 Transcript_9282/m.21569 type:complete len:261 (+) Transcript_9282:8-790(+)
MVITVQMPEKCLRLTSAAMLLCSTCTPAHGHQGGRCAGGAKRVRQHVNPLRSAHQKVLSFAPDWPQHAFARPHRQLHVDIGCARGLFAMDLAQAQPEWNVLGLEIRSVLVDAAQQDVLERQLGNAHFLACNANVNLAPLLKGVESYGPLRSVSLQFPDPWFKTKHHKRRTLQPQLISTIAEHLQPGGWFFLQTDVLPLAEEMREMVRTTEPSRLPDVRADETDWAVAKPAELSGLATERERASEALGRPVYRCLFTRGDA